MLYELLQLLDIRFFFAVLSVRKVDEMHQYYNKNVIFYAYYEFSDIRVQYKSMV